MLKYVDIPVISPAGTHGMSDPRRDRDCVKQVSRQGLHVRAESTLLRVWVGGILKAISILRDGRGEETIRR